MTLIHIIKIAFLSLNRTKNKLFNLRQNLILGLTLTLLSSSLTAETITIPLGQQGNPAAQTKPQIGLSKEQVEAQFGAPLTQRGPVGQPPIFTWDYEQFTVYFEGDSVIHSVIKHHSPAE